MKHIFKVSLFALFSVLFVTLTGCEPKDPFINPGEVEDPNWKATTGDQMTSSMTAVVRLNFDSDPGTMAAFIDDVCCGVATYVDGLYYLYITPATEAGGKVQLNFYSPSLKRIFVSKEKFDYVNDSMLGSVSKPYEPQWEVPQQN